MSFIIIGIIVILLLLYLSSPSFNCQCQTYGKLYKGNYNNRPVKYVAWTGGFDSTALLCIALLRNPIQPIYICAPNTDTAGWFQGRQNITQEIQHMRRIRQLINAWQQPHFELLPTLYVWQLKYDKETTESMNALYKNGYMTRPMTQYGAILATSRYLNIPIQVGIERAATGEFRQYLLKETMNGTQELKSYTWRNVKFPILSMTKEDLKQRMRELQAQHILHATISCWYPTINNETCGKCPMCKERLKDF